MEIPQGDTYIFSFTTRAFATGIPTTLAGTPVLSVKEEANDTIITAGVTVDVDTGGTPVTGLNEASVVATSGNGYEVGKYYSVYVSTGTVDAVSVVGEVVGHFRCVPPENNAGEKVVDVASAAGTAWASGAITAASLGADAITSAKIADDAISSEHLNTGALTADAFAANALVAATFAADCITAAKIADDAITADQLSANAIAEIWGNICESEGSRTAQQILSILLAACAGVTADSGATLKTPEVAGATRISATINGSNERTAVSLTPSS